MKIVIDTNVVISAIFFGGNPRKVVEAVLDEKLTACANQEIIDEYLERKGYIHANNRRNKSSGQ